MCALYFGLLFLRAAICSANFFLNLLRIVLKLRSFVPNYYDNSQLTLAKLAHELDLAKPSFAKKQKQAGP